MQRIRIAATAFALGIAAGAFAEEVPGKPEIPPAEMHVTITAPEGTTDRDITAAIATEQAKRDPAAQAAAAAEKRKADADEAHAKRISRVCDSIPEDAMRRDPSLRRMCQ